MPSRRPPSQRDPAYALHRLPGTVAQAAPGLKVKNAAPVKAGTPSRKATPTSGGGMLGAAYVSATMGSGLTEVTTHNSTAISIDEEHGDHGLSTDGTTLYVAAGIYVASVFAGPVTISGGASTDIVRARMAMPVVVGDQLFGGTFSNELTVTASLWFGSAGSGVFQFEFDVLNQTGRTATLDSNQMRANILRFPFPT